MRITFVTRTFGNVERNSHCDVLHIAPVRVANLVLDGNGVLAIKAYTRGSILLYDDPDLHINLRHDVKRALFLWWKTMRNVVEGASQRARVCNLWLSFSCPQSCGVQWPCILLQPMSLCRTLHYHNPSNTSFHIIILICDFLIYPVINMPPSWNICVEFMPIHSASIIVWVTSDV